MACSSETRLVNSLHFQKTKIPSDLLSIDEFEKPVVESEIDIINAYSSLFLLYKKCVVNIEKIKELNEE